MLTGAQVTGMLTKVDSKVAKVSYSHVLYTIATLLFCNTITYKVDSVWLWSGWLKFLEEIPNNQKEHWRNYSESEEKTHK